MTDKNDKIKSGEGAGSDAMSSLFDRIWSGLQSAGSGIATGYNATNDFVTGQVDQFNDSFWGTPDWIRNLNKDPAQGPNPLDGLPSGPSSMSPGVPSPTIVPGMGGNVLGLPPRLEAQFKSIAESNAAFANTPFSDLGKLKLWGGKIDKKRVPYGGQLASNNGKPTTTQYENLVDSSTLPNQKDENGKPIDMGDSSEGVTNVVTGAQYMDKWFNMNDKAKAKMMTKFVKAGILTPDQAMSNALGSSGEEAGQRAFQYLIQQASLKFQTSGTRVTPEDLLDQAMKTGHAENLYRTSVDKSFNISDGMSANKALTGMLSDRIGRLPTKAEKAAFLSALNAYERANPSVRKTNTNVVSGDSTSTTSGGSDSAGFAQDYTQNHNQAEYGAVQGATTYYKAFMDMLSGG